MRGFIRYYKWHLLFSLLVFVCIVFIYVSLTTQTSPDMTIGYAGDKYINIQTFNDNKAEIELLLHDANDDGKKTANFVTYTADLQKDIDEAFAELIDSGDYDIYIASKETFKAYKDKKAFADAATYVSFGEKEYDTLKDSSGRIYATSLKDNTLARRLGIVEPEGLYIAAANDDDGELTSFKKNGRNLTGYIIDSKEKYR